MYVMRDDGTYATGFVEYGNVNKNTVRVRIHYDAATEKFGELLVRIAYVDVFPITWELDMIKLIYGK